MDMNTTVESQSTEVEERAEELSVQVELLQEEIDRLRTEYVRAKRASHRRAAIGLAIVGLVAALAGIGFPGERSILFAIGATGLFAAVITAYLTPERFVAASVGERVYGGLAETIADLIAALGLSDRRIYVPIDDDTVRLFIPAMDAAELPASRELRELLVVTEDASGRGVSLHPTGGALLADLADVDEAASVVSRSDLLAEALVETFELVDTVEPSVDASAGRVTFAITGSAYGRIDRVDHPVPSFLACGLARVTNRPVDLSVLSGDDRVDYLVSCDWDASATE